MNPLQIRRQSESLVAEGRIQEAGALVAQGLELQAFNPDLTIAKANIMLAGRQYRQAIETLGELLKRRSDLPDAVFLLGNAYRATRLFNEAARCYQQTLVLQPTYPEASKFLGLMRQQLGDLAGAVEAFRAASDLRPELPMPKFRLGAALHMLDRHQEAIAAYRQALRRDPAYGPAYTNLALALLAVDDDTAAAEVARTHLAHAPGNILALANLLYAARGMQDLATVASLFDTERLIRNGRLPTESLASWASRVTTLPAASGAADSSFTSQEFSPDDQPDLRPVTDAIEALVGAHLADCRQLSEHPWAAALPSRWSLRCWAEIKAPGRVEDTHCHPRACLSGLAYLDVPAADSGEHQVEFGVGDEAYLHRGPSEPVLRSVAAGTMLVFPGYFFHRTLPFEAEAPRVRIAFDVVAEP